MAIYDATDGDNWTGNANWKSQEPVGDWYGVTVENGVVTRLNLPSNNLTGTLPAEIGDLTSLEFLDLVNNALSGAIPAEIWNLTNLEDLVLNANALSGAIPAEIRNLTSLRRLAFSGNQLSGAIPAEIGNLTRLEHLDLGANSLSGSIPAEIGNLTNLETLFLCRNSLSGAIPAETGNLTSLEVLALCYNTELTGELPAGLRLLPINYLDIRETCIATPADSDFQAWLAGITTFHDTDRVCTPSGVTVTPTALTITEGSSAKYTVVLTSQPSADVTISLSFASGSDADITVDNISLTFTMDNWNVAQEVTVSAPRTTMRQTEARR